MDEERTRRLRAIPLFAEVADSTLERIARSGAEVELQQGQVVIQPGEPGSGMYVLEEGAVTVELRSGALELGPGEFFGELSLLVPDAPRSARVRVTAPGRCFAISRPEIVALLEEEPGLALAMLRALARRLLETNAQTPHHRDGLWLDLIVAGLRPANAASARVAVKIGMRLDREASGPHCEALLIYALARADWRAVGVR